MTSYIELEILPISEAVDVLIEKINFYFFKNSSEALMSPYIETEIASLVDKLKEELYCIIEYPYVDKVYRDSFYNYYASKHQTYQRDCIRVSLFEEEIKVENFLDKDKHVELNGKYLGYFIIRPTISALLGRSIINPKAFEENSFKICSFKSKSFIHGVKLDIEGFPHSSQDGETIKCAETTIWALMEYFGHKYPDYSPALPARIHKAIERFSYQRQLPSNGLTMDQISFALKEFGFGTITYSELAYGEKLFNIIDCYIESGIPVLIGLQSGYTGHVIIGIGKKHEEEIDWEHIEQEQLNKVKYYKATNIPAQYVIQDDNLIPYRLINLTSPGSNYENESDTDESDMDESDNPSKYKIDSIVVPLYPKIYLESVIAEELILQIISDQDIGYKFQPNFVFRFHLTSSRSFKNHVTLINDMPESLKSNLLITKMPKFIWIGEFYTKEAYSSVEKNAIGIVILDATEANQESIDALIFAGYPDRCITLNENNYVTLQQKLENYRYHDNLKNLNHEK